MSEPVGHLIAGAKKARSGIAKWPEDERPRERLLSRGPRDLTDAELIAILLRVGVRGRSAVEPSDSDKLLTRDLIAACHPIGIKVLDHVIVARDEHYSIADTGPLDELGLDTLAPTPTRDE